jgi:Na+-transporting NADH:ubiquinone oxidoreductase subunit F
MDMALQVKIIINNGEKQLEVKSGLSLLATLSEHGIFLPSACGGRGICASCRLTVTEGGGQAGPVEEQLLTAPERAAGTRLSCQVKVRNDMKIEIPRHLFLAGKFRATLIAKKPLTHDIVECTLALAGPGEILFAAGQYVQLRSKVYDGKESVARAYSIASPPSDTSRIQLIVRLVPNGICSTWVFDHLKEGDKVTLTGPYGNFRLSGSDSPVILIAGGSGMAPMWSIVCDMQGKGIDRRPTYYFFGALSRADLFYVEPLQALERQCPWFHFIPALSKEPPDSGWTGERGLITEVVARHFPDCSRHEAYLCGAPGMIDACLKVLTRGGMPKEKIFYDKFA